jgi:PST family polysaccharide transporter
VESETLDNPISTEEGNKLGKTAIKSFGWNLAGSMARYGTGFLINIVFARILGPEPFGLIAMAMIIISISNLIIDSGLNAGIVQKKELTDKNIRLVFTIQIIGQLLH